ncbi:MAG TPA: DUF302 domain-containing protein [Thermoanaerobaculia bacterium]|nr:DUF302 domain-containing protein [Thermoanaerobaculia bacterium]
MPEVTQDYGLRQRLDLPYEVAVEHVTEALRREGFGVLTRIDVRETLKEKLDADFRRYVILGACNPPLAHRALEAELEIGLQLPCNVIVYEDRGGSVVSIADPAAMLEVAGNPRLEPIAAEARERLCRVLDHLGAEPVGRRVLRARSSGRGW